jgi:DNA-binding Lrp family transcriptional regulator
VALPLEEEDIKLLQALLRDARRSFRKLSKELGLSTASLIRRTRRLEGSGVIRGYAALVDWEKLGYEITAIIEITVSRGKLLEMESEIARLPEVCAVYDVTGLTDAFVIAKFRSRSELSAFVKRLLSMPFVERTNTHVVLTCVKEDFRPLEGLALLLAGKART